MRLQGLHIPEERALAGKIAAALYLTASATGLALPFLPGVEVRDTAILLACSGAGFAWSVTGLLLIDWARVPPYVSLASSISGLPLSALVMAESGGASSPARFYMLFVVTYAAYFYVRREAIALLLGCLAVLATPFAYQSGLAASGYVAELIVLVPIYVVVTVLILAARRLQLDLRARADGLALTDALTGVANRRALDRALQADPGSSRSTDRAGLLLVDVDDFKDANTELGHIGGDRVLRGVAGALRDAAREHDLVARLGGDEFAILATDLSAADAEKMAQRVLDAVRAVTPLLDTGRYALSVSVGWATVPGAAEDRSELYHHADAALAAAKLAGKATHAGAPDYDTPADALS